MNTTTFRRDKTKKKERAKRDTGCLLFENKTQSDDIITDDQDEKTRPDGGRTVSRWDKTG